MHINKRHRQQRALCPSFSGATKFVHGIEIGTAEEDTEAGTEVGRRDWNEERRRERLESDSEDEVLESKQRGL